MKDTLKGGFWVALGLFILYLAVTGRLNQLPQLWAGITSWWNAGPGGYTPSSWVKPSSGPATTVPDVGAQARAITLMPLPVGPALMS